MTFALLLKLATTIVSVALGFAILARDHELRANRLIAAFLFCSGWWAGSEFVLFRGVDAPTALLICRVMAFGWMPLGVLCMHASLTLSAMENHPIARTLPFFYAAVVLMLPIAVGTDLVIRDVSATEMGWQARYGLGFVIAYLLLIAPVVSVLACWRGVMSIAGPEGQLQLSRIVFFGISGAVISGTVTAVILPLLGVPVLGITTTLIALVGIAVTLTLQRFGYSLISPEAFAREILDTLEDGVVVVDDEGLVRDANRAFARLVGARDGEVAGRKLTRWIPDFVPAKKTDPSESMLLDVRTWAGERIPVWMSAAMACHGSGRFVGRAHLLRDRREMISLQRQLAISVRLAAVGDLSRAIARAIEEPLVVARRELDALSIEWQALIRILDRLEGIDELGEDPREGLELIAECLEGADRISSIVHEVGGFSSGQSHKDLQIHALDEIVRQSIRIARAQAADSLEIEAILDPDVRILCHRSQIERVVTNLIVNAIQALELRADRRGHLAIGVASRGDEALLHIEDDGCGIDPEVLDRIFDPFFTTKPVGKGTGLGLPISYHIVKEHGGGIHVSSMSGRGTHVTVVLPRVRVQRTAGGRREKR